MMLAKEGYIVICAARREDKCIELTVEIQEAGYKALDKKCDVTKLEDCEALIEGAAQIGPI